MPSTSAKRATDRVSAVAWLVLVSQLLVAGGATTAPGRRAMALLLGAGALYVAARVAPFGVRLPLLAGLLAGIVAAVLLVPDVRSGAPLAEPLGYGNANGALLAVGVVAALVLLATASGLVRWLAGAAGTVLLLALPMTRSATATALAAGAALATALAWRYRGAGWVVAAASCAAMVAVVLATVLLGSGYGGAGSGAAADALSSRRIHLWDDAIDIASRTPWTGQGIGAFPRLSRTAQADADTRFAHSLPLEFAAEAGILAGGSVVLLLLSLAAAPIVRSARPEAIAAAWAIVVFGTQAAIDYTYRFPAVVLTAAAVAGLSAGLSRVTSPESFPPRADS